MGKYVGYVGTYTTGISKGIYYFLLDTEAQKLSECKVVAKLKNPIYITVSRDNKYLYAVSEAGDKGGVASFKINDSTGELALLNSEMSYGPAPCHVSVKSDTRNVVTANYDTAKVESYLTNEDGSLKPAVSVIEHEGSGPHERQEKPHMHFAGFTVDEKFVISTDLGSDKVITYQADNGRLTSVQTLKTQAGSGPRHIAFHPNGQFAYVLTELSNEIITLNFNTEDGSFTELQYISTLPEDFTGNNQGSAIHISCDGKFIYAGNRGHDSIAIFQVDEVTGKLNFVEWTHTEGNWPRDFAIDPTGKFVVASNQETGNLVLYSRNAETGKLTLLQTNISVPDPVCVKFLHVKLSN